MVHTCASKDCSNRCSVLTRSRGITFHCFPKDVKLKKLWEVALKRKGFTANRSSRICSEHFREEDFDRTGQTVRLRGGVIPSVFSFTAHLPKPAVTRTSQTSIKALEHPSKDCFQPVKESKPPLVPNADHAYALLASPTVLKARLNETLDRIESLERERRNAKDRERRTKKLVRGLLEELRQKNLVIEELKTQLGLKKKKGTKLIKKS